MANQRVNIIVVGSGFKGSGKTYKALHWISNYVQPRDGSAPRKVLIFDTNMEYTADAVQKAGLNFPIKTIKANDVLLFNRHPMVECVRVLPIMPNGKMMNIDEKKEMAWSLMQSFRGGLIVLDDINSYVLDVTHESDFVGTVMNNAHRNQDILINFQSINMLNPVLSRNLDFVRMHVQADEVDDKFKDRTEIYTLARGIIEIKYAGGDHHFNVLIDNHKYKITGAYTNEDFTKACYKYLTRKKPRLIKEEMGQLGHIKDAQQRRITAITNAIKQLKRYDGSPQ